MLAPDVEATVGLVQPNYSINENSGSVRVCVSVAGPRLSCPIGFAFRLRLTSLTSSAGEVLSRH